MARGSRFFYIETRERQTQNDQEPFAYHRSPVPFPTAFATSRWP